MNKDFSLIFLALIILLSSTQTLAAHKTHNEITVTGLVFREYFYEQPSYGKRPASDTIGSACMLKLDSTSIDKDLPFEKLHLIIPTKMTNCTTLSGHRIEISGDLDEVTNGRQHGDALIDVRSYRIIR